jgi:selT/selW/selH-like putative selenoprotein
LAAEIKKKVGVDTELIQSKGGAFEVKVDGKLIFSKLELGRFPEHSEILGQLRA